MLAQATFHAVEGPPKFIGDSVRIGVLPPPLTPFLSTSSSDMTKILWTPWFRLQNGSDDGAPKRRSRADLGGLSTSSFSLQSPHSGGQSGPAPIQVVLQRSGFLTNHEQTKWSVCEVDKIASDGFFHGTVGSEDGKWALSMKIQLLSPPATTASSMLLPPHLELPPPVSRSQDTPLEAEIERAFGYPAKIGMKLFVRGAATQQKISRLAAVVLIPNRTFEPIDPEDVDTFSVNLGHSIVVTVEGNGDVRGSLWRPDLAQELNTAGKRYATNQQSHASTQTGDVAQLLSPPLRFSVQDATISATPAEAERAEAIRRKLLDTEGYRLAQADLAAAIARESAAIEEANRLRLTVARLQTQVAEMERLHKASRDELSTTQSHVLLTSQKHHHATRSETWTSLAGEVSRPSSITTKRDGLAKHTEVRQTPPSSFAHFASPSHTVQRNLSVSNWRSGSQRRSVSMESLGEDDVTL